MTGSHKSAVTPVERIAHTIAGIETATNDKPTARVSRTVLRNGSCPSRSRIETKTVGIPSSKATSTRKMTNESAIRPASVPAAEAPSLATVRATMMSDVVAMTMRSVNHNPVRIEAEMVVNSGGTPLVLMFTVSHGNRAVTCVQRSGDEL